MPRPMLRPQENQRSDAFRLTSENSQAQKITAEAKFRLDQRLRKKRSKEYIKAIKELDVGGHANMQKTIKEIVDKIKGEFPEAEIKGIILGIVAPCYIGPEYEVHTINVFAAVEHYEAGEALPNGIENASGIADQSMDVYEIAKHYKKGQSLPSQLEKARGLAMSENYEMVEVYADCCRAIDSMGNVAVVK